jgi:hypothetical protein
MTKPTKQMQRMARAGAFCEVLVISVVIQAVVNMILEKAGIQMRLALYETALIWMFCK